MQRPQPHEVHKESGQQIMTSTDTVKEKDSTDYIKQLRQNFFKDNTIGLACNYLSLKTSKRKTPGDFLYTQTEIVSNLNSEYEGKVTKRMVAQILGSYWDPSGYFLA